LLLQLINAAPHYSDQLSSYMISHSPESSLFIPLSLMVTL
jgi:hypothetical protein